MIIKMYKKSKYNILLRGEDKNLVIGNTLTGTVHKYASSIAEQIVSHLKKEAFDDTDLISKTLIKDGILVKEELNEDQMAEFYFNKLNFGDQALNLIVVPTDACNMRCIYCYEPHIEHYMNDENVCSLIKFLKKKMRTATSVHISWFGGEPLLRPDIIYTVMEQVQRLGKLYKIPISASATTNGVLLSPVVFNHLYECGVRSYQITIDGFKEHHNQSRPMVDGSDSFSIIESNLKNILRSDKKVVVFLRYNMTAEDIDRSYSFIDYLKETYFHDNRFLMNIYNVRNWGGESVQQLSLASYSALGKVMKYAIKQGINPVGAPTIAYDDLRCELAPINSFYINWDLSVHKCYSTIYNEDSCIGHIGTINSSGVLKLDEEKMALWSVPPQCAEKCLKCPFYAACMSFSCPYEYKIRQNKECHDFQTFIIYKIRFVGQMMEAKTIEECQI